MRRSAVRNCSSKTDRVLYSGLQTPNYDPNKTELEQIDVRRVKVNVSALVLVMAFFLSATHVSRISPAWRKASFQTKLLFRSLNGGVVILR